VLALNSEPAATDASSELDLIERAQAGDADAFCELCRVHGGGLLRQAMFLCGNPVTAEDLAQETLVEAWKSVRRYNGQCRLFTWLCSILLHRQRKLLRKKRAIAFSFFWRADRDDIETRLANIADPRPVPDESAEVSERAVQLRRSLEKLPGKQREVIYLRFYVSESLEGIAAAVGCSIGTVKSRLFNGLERLRKMKSLEESRNS
jgi:RNA polymerase sigma-70 factor (ECF subfamily)